MFNPKSWYRQKTLDPFWVARLRLTGWYLLILGSLIAGFSYISFQAKESAYVRVYTVVSNYSQDQKKLVELKDNYAEFNKRFKQQILWLDSALIISAGVTAWWLAGRTLKPIRLMMEEQAAFAAGISHGLRTPLTSMNLQMEAFKRQNPRITATWKSFLGDLAQEITHMTRIVEGVLVLSRAKTNQASHKTPMTDLSLIMHTVKAEMLPLASAKKQTLSVTIPKKETWIKGDTDQWHQVLNILIDNAIKYVPNQGKITTETQNQIGFIRIIVSDNGPGISKADRVKIFESYYRGKQKGKVPGAGLGLAIAAKIIEQTGGNIRITENQPQGAKFIVKALKT